MSSRATLRTGTRRSALAGFAFVIAAAGIVACAPEPAPTSFPPWYPLENEQGDPAFADFESHVPCAIDPEPEPDCQRVKLGVVLYRDAETEQPTTYLMSIVRVGVSDEREVHGGEWGIETGTPLDAEATVYRLDSGAPDHLRWFWALGDDLLLLLDAEREPRVGDAAYSYTLNSIPLGRMVTVP